MLSNICHNYKSTISFSCNYKNIWNYKRQSDFKYLQQQSFEKKLINYRLQITNQRLYQITNYKLEVPNYKLQIRGTKLQISNVCSGKARRGDGNDLTANPKKLAAIGETIRFFKTLIIVISFHCRKRAWKVEQRYKLFDSSERGAFPNQVRENSPWINEKRNIGAIFLRDFAFCQETRNWKFSVKFSANPDSSDFHHQCSLNDWKNKSTFKAKIGLSETIVEPKSFQITTFCHSGQSHEKRRTSWRAELAGKKDSLNMLLDEHPLPALPSNPCLVPF